MTRKRQIAILVSLLVVLVAVNLVSYRRARPPAVAEKAAPEEKGSKRPAIAQDPTLRLDLLDKAEKVQYSGTQRNIFQFRAVAPPPTAAQTGPPPPPPPPPIPLKFFGFATAPATTKRIFLANGDDVFVVSEGDVVMKQYRVVKIGVNTVEVEDLSAKRRATLPLEAQ